MRHSIFRLSAISLSAILVLSIVPIDPQTADAFSIDVRVTIKTVEALDEVDSITTADFYPEVFIDGTKFGDYTLQIVNDNTIEPNWAFTKSVDSSKGSIPIVIKIFDDDDFLNGDVDHIDLDPDVGPRNVDLVLTFGPCGISGEVTGDCNATLNSSGTENDSAKVTFSIEILAPGSGSGLQVYCLHSPIWPQPGEQVTITAVALDDELNPKVVDDIEIWVNDQNAPVSSIPGVISSFTAGPFEGLPNESTFSYSCRVIDNGNEAFTGWRVVHVGAPDPQDGKAIPVLYVGERLETIDVVFIPDKDDYASPTDNDFLNDIETAIDTYYNYDVYLTNQDTINFWIGQDFGDSGRDSSDKCILESPDNWDMDYSFADVGVIIHPIETRDCADRVEKIFSSEPVDPDTSDNRGSSIPHETGHVPFGLADEYDDAQYNPSTPFPNMFDDETNCKNDLDNMAMTCRTVIDKFGVKWYTFDPSSDDLMVDNFSPQFLDKRRINYIFDVCDAGGC